MKTFTKIFVTVTLFITANAANAGVVVIVGSGSSLESMEKREVSDIFLNKSSSFPNGDQAVAIAQLSSLDISDSFNDEVTGKSSRQLRSYWSKLVFSGKGQPPKEVDNDQEVVDLISINPNMIGYIDSSFLNDTVKVVFEP